MRKILRISLLGMLTMFSTMALAQTEETLTIADLHKMTKDKANITLSIADGKVVYADANAIHVRDGEYAVIFFKTNLNLPANAKVKGTVKVDYDNYYGVHEVKANAGTNTDNLTIEESTEEAVPVEATVEDILGLKHLCDLVIVKNVTITKEGQNFFIVSGDKKVQLYKGIDVSGYVDGKAYNVTGLFNNIYKKEPEVSPLKVESAATSVSEPTADSDKNAPAYNLAGQRTNKAARGIYIQNGRKYVAK
ncbi:MAG: hypothetical protein PUH24_00805 [Prevotellaceae bacterium]|nr:hypothetical protein [Prevotella sp.]MDD7256821.1 hypothetical protein [Prevotellaceae bacterium]MDY6131151.1 hypothetical protein [Prevotella sp.]